MSQQNNDEAALAFLLILIGVPVAWIAIVVAAFLKGGGAT